MFFETNQIKASSNVKTKTLLTAYMAMEQLNRRNKRAGAALGQIRSV